MTGIGEAHPGGGLVVYGAADAEVATGVGLQNIPVWLTREQVVAVFGSTSANVRQHLRDMFVDGVLEEPATTKAFFAVRSERDCRVRRRIRRCSLDAIISIGYRVSLKRAARFRECATRSLRERLVSGYTLNLRRLAGWGGGRWDRTWAQPPNSHSVHPVDRQSHGCGEGPHGSPEPQPVGGTTGMRAVSDGEHP